MKYTVSDERATLILNRGYVPESGATETESGHNVLVGKLTDLIAESASRIGIADLDGIGEVYPGFQKDHLVRAELLSWRLITGGLIEELALFLRTHAPAHAIVLTFDFQDEPSRALESPFIVIFPQEVIGGFELCDMPDTQVILGFPSSADL